MDRFDPRNSAIYYVKYLDRSGANVSACSQAAKIRQKHGAQDRRWQIHLEKCQKCQGKH